MAEKGTIRVTGRGMLKLRPDLTRLTLTLQGREPEYADALRRSAEDTRTLRGALEGLGFAADALKTLFFNVDAAYESYRDERGDYRNRLVGYEFRHTLKLDFPSDNERLGRTLYALAHSSVQAEVNISYTLSDPEAAKNALLERAVRDARAKAEVLSAAAQRRLGGLLSVDYSWGEVNVAVQPMRKLAAAEACCDSAANRFDLDMEPDDVDLSDSVTLVRELEE